jgi:hypothetical protein
VTGAGCNEIRADAAELALGVLDGEQRAQALEHARSCADCRAHLAELAVVGEQLLAIAPAHEPPPGFESRVLDALPQTRRRAPRIRRLVPALAAAMLLAAGGATWVTLSSTREERDLGARYRAVLDTAGGKYLVARELRDGAGRKSGVVFAYQGDQPWITVVLSASVRDPAWSVAITSRDGTRRELGRFDVAATGRAWGHALPVHVRTLDSVQLSGSDGRELRAQISKR